MEEISLPSEHPVTQQAIIFNQTLVYPLSLLQHSKKKQHPPPLQLQRRTKQTRLHPPTVASRQTHRQRLWAINSIISSRSNSSDNSKDHIAEVYSHNWVNRKWYWINAKRPRMGYVKSSGCSRRMLILFGRGSSKDPYHSTPRATNMSRQELCRFVYSLMAQRSNQKRKEGVNKLIKTIELC